MSGNGYGDYRTTGRADMAAHDRSSSVIRWLANYAVANWASVALIDMVEAAVAKGALRDVALKALARHMHRHETADTARTYGADHPEAAGRR